MKDFVVLTGKAIDLIKINGLKTDLERRDYVEKFFAENTYKYDVSYLADLAHDKEKYLDELTKEHDRIIVLTQNQEVIQYFTCEKSEIRTEE